MKRRTTLAGMLAFFACVSGLAALRAAEVQLVEGRPLDERFVLRFEAHRTGEAAADLVLHWTDAEHYCALQFAADGIRLIKVEGGKQAELGAVKDVLDGTDKFVLKRLDDRFILYHDRKKILEARAEKPGRGKLGVRVSGHAGFAALKYQALGEIAYRDGFMRSTEDVDPWSVQSGRFAIASASHPELSVSPFRYVGVAEPGAAALSTHGEWFWADYDARAAMRAAPVTAGETVSSYAQCRGTPSCYLPSGRLEVLDIPEVSPALRAETSPVELGLAFYVEGPATYRLLRVTAQPQEVQLVEVLEGKERIVARRPVRLAPREWFSLRVLVKGERVRCYVDECLAFSERLEGLLYGSAGLWTRGADGKEWQAEFDDVSVRELDGISEEDLGAPQDTPALRRRLERPEPGGTWVPNYFTYQLTMSEWADPRNTYVPKGPYAWYVGTLFEDAEVRWRAGNELFKRGKWSAVFAADGADLDPAHGYAVTLEVPAEGAARATALRNGETLGTREVAFVVTQGAREFRLGWRGGSLRLWIDGREAAVFEDPQPLPGRMRAGVSVNGQPALPTALDVLSTHLWDETFSRAPVAWRSGAGAWELVSRWACSPRYTWFGGKGPGSSQAVLWSKRAFEGDLVLDAYVAPGMSDRFTPFYDRPINFALSFGADGRDLFSGYTFCFGFQDDPSRLYRKDRVVAESSAFADPLLRTGIEAIFSKIHQHWYHVRVERSGKLLRCFVDDRKLAEFEDPEPLGGGALALWSMGSNGILVSRLRLSFGNGGGFDSPFLDPAIAAKPETAPSAPLALTLGPAARVDLPASAWKALGSDPSGPAVRVEGDAGMDAPADAIGVTNLRSGGHFAISAALKDVDAVKLPYLAFSYHLSPRARVNAYVQCKGRLWRIALTGPAADTAHSLPLWKDAAARADGTWHAALVPLREVLRAQFPDEAVLPVDALVLGNFEEDDALSCGLGGNGPGETYALARAAFLAAQDPMARVTLKATAPPVEALTGMDANALGRPNKVLSAEQALELGGTGLQFVHVRWGGEGARVWHLPVAVAPGGEEKAPLGANAAQRPLDLAVTLPEAPLLESDFEQDLGAPESFDGPEGVELFREAQTREGDAGGHVMRVSARGMGGCLGLYLRRAPFDVRKYPLLEFDICIDPGTQINLQLRSRESRFEMTLTDRTPGWNVVGEAEGIADDRRWHHVCLDLKEAVRQATGGGSPLDFLVRDLALADSGFAGNTSRACYRMDNLRLSAAVPVKEKVALSWRAPGAVSYEVRFDREPTTQPGEADRTKETERSFEVPESGSYFLHACALDAEGHRGPVVHRRMLCRRTVDVTPPVADRPYPADGARACSGELRARVRDEGDGLCLQDVVFEVNGKVFKSGEGRMAYDPETQEVRLRLPAAPGRSPFAPGEQVQVVLRARDLAGNALEQPLAWHFTFDAAAWNEAPAAPYIVNVPCERLFFEDYESGLGMARNRRGTIVAQDHEAALGAGALSVSNRMHGDFYQATLVSRGFEASKHPILSFDLQPVSAQDFTLMFIVRNRFCMLTLNGRGYNTNDDWESLERMDVAWTPGRWTPVRVDLRKYFPELKRGEPLYVSAISTAGQANPIGATLRFDNLCVSSDAGRDLEFVWQPPADPSGIQGYAAVLDRHSDTVPAEELNVHETRFLQKAVQAGTWYLHVRALNGSGKWGAAAHAQAVVE